MVFILIGSSLIAFSIIDYKKAFIMYLAFRSCLNENIVLFETSSGVRVTLMFFIDFAFFLMYIVKKTGMRTFGVKEKFPLYTPFTIIGVSWMMSALFSLAGFSSEVTRVVSNVTSELIFIYLIWQIVVTKKDFRRVVGCFAIIIIISCLYAFIESIIKINQLAEYETTLLRDGVNYTYDIMIARGYRVKSIFFHAIGAGMNWALFIIFSFYIFRYKNKMDYKMIQYVLLSILCLISIVLTKCRAPYMFLLLSVIPLLNLKKRRIAIGAIFAMFIAVLLIYAFRDYLDVFLSIFSTEAQSTVRGSNFPMRIKQLEASFYYLLKSPLVGLGNKYRDFVPRDFFYYAMAGSESVWFLIIPCYGIIGIFAEVVLIFYMSFILPKKYKSKEMKVISIAYWITYTMTSLPGFLTYIFYVLYFWLIRREHFYNDN